MLNDTGFDLWAENYDRYVAESNGYPFEGYYDVLDHVYNRIGWDTPGPKILDVGFGTGTLTYRLYRNGAKVYGIDFSSKMTEIARRKMPEAHFIEADFSRGLPDEVKNVKFDFIVSTYALHHLDNEHKVDFIAELKSLLNPGGKIIIGDIAFKTTSELEKCRLYYPDGWDEDEIYIVFDEIRSSLLSRGLDCTYTQVSDCAGVLVIE